MENVKKIVSQNLIKLRKENNLTQAELAKLINYSDKAISRWETGEVVPDLETIYALSEVFDVPVSFITEKYDDETARGVPSAIGQRILSQLFFICEIWFILCVIYVYINITRHESIWQIFVWGVPASAFILWFFNRKEKASIFLFCVTTVFTWSLITCIYLHMIDNNPWYIYFVGLPSQGLLIVRYIFNYKQDLKRRLKRRGAKRSE